MKRIAIITISDNDNYGNRLQNYALQEVLKSKKNKVYTLWNKCIKCTFYDKSKKTIKKILKIFVKKYRENEKEIDKKRKKAFESFTNKYINNYYKTIYTGNNLKELGNKFDKFIIGSDQIWNYNFRGMFFGQFEFGMFAKKEKCISYSASIGINGIPEEKINVYKEGLNHISQLSIREDIGADIIEEITGRKAEVLLDPTMLLSGAKWERVLKKPKNMYEEKYILTYFVGGISEKRKSELNEITKKNNIKIISLNEKNNEYYTCGPSEFIYLIKNSEMVITDSFHACVFSILFEKDFFVLQRTDECEDISSRIDTLLSKYELQDRKIEKIVYDIRKIDFKRVNKKIEEERKKSIQFLEKSLTE